MPNNEDWSGYRTKTVSSSFKVKEDVVTFLNPSAKLNPLKYKLD
jgi:hypothetical protein